MGDNNISNPKRLLFKEYFCNPESESFGDALNSALKAGYEESYARQITAPSTDLKWVRDIMRREELMDLSEGVLKDKLIEGSLDAAKFVAKRLGKKHYSERTEVTGADGKDLNVTVVNYGETKED